MEPANADANNGTALFCHTLLKPISPSAATSSLSRCWPGSPEGGGRARIHHAGLVPTATDGIYRHFCPFWLASVSLASLLVSSRSTLNWDNFHFPAVCVCVALPSCRFKPVTCVCIHTVMLCCPCEDRTGSGTWARERRGFRGLCPCGVFFTSHLTKTGPFFPITDQSHVQEVHIQLSPSRLLTVSIRRVKWARFRFG